MNPECFPITAVPGLARIFLDYCSGESALRGWYGAVPRDRGWQGAPSLHSAEHRSQVADLLAGQNSAVSLQPAIEQIRQGANAVVTGQQVGVLGGPLFTVHKAATAVALAAQASESGRAHVPIFWLASEDHDFAEVNHVIFPGKRELRTLTWEATPPAAVPVGQIVLDDSIAAVGGVIEQAWELLGYSDAMEWLAAAYRPGQTLAQAFAEFYSKVFESQRLLILDAAGREAHRLGAPVLAAAIERADELHNALTDRNREILSAGYHAQVAVAERGSLLFLIDSNSGAGHNGARNALKRTPPSATEPQGLWQAGREHYSTDDLLGILAAEPERISPSALLRPVFQDQILPTSAYIGGPAEIAYFAQSAVLFERILGRLTPVLPRLSATLVEPAIAQLLDRHELSLETIFASTAESLAQRLGARAMPIAGKQRIANAGNALDTELTALTDYMGTLDEGLGRSAHVSASKMRYQMNRLRRMAATFELQKEASLGRHASAVVDALYPHNGLQERTIGAAYFLARYVAGVVETLVREAADGCPGHKLIRL